MNQKVRLDLAMLERKLVLTRSQARMLIKQGDVSVNSIIVKRAGYPIKSTDLIEICHSELYVSRGAYKLKSAIESFKLNFQGLAVMDCGASTGGFTEILLKEEVNKVYCLDVGHGQLHPKIKSDSRVVNLEGLNLKHSFRLSNGVENELVDSFVMDLSFISIKQVVKNVKENLKTSAFGVLLIKPQFEVGKEKIKKNGLVDSDEAIECANNVKRWLQSEFSFVSKLLPSPIKGKTGNQEFLVWVRL